MENESNVGNGQAAPAGANVAYIVSLLIGLWFFVSPWVYGAAGNPNAWNSWIVGALIALFSLIRLGSRGGATYLGWANAILAVWVFISPWVYGYTANTGRFVNSLCVGVVVFVISLAAGSVRRTHLTHSPVGH